MTEKSTKKLIEIKGSNKGIVFKLNEAAMLKDICEELAEVINKEMGSLAIGTNVRINIDAGKRELNEQEKQHLRDIVESKDNLFLASVVSADASVVAVAYDIKLHQGNVRSGQVVEYDGHLLIHGDVHNGAKLKATGNIYVMGMVSKCVLQAGLNGERDATITASYWRNCQVIIADVVGEIDMDRENAQKAYIGTAWLDGDNISFKYKNPLNI